jgi:hypothetical protein
LTACESNQPPAATPVGDDQPGQCIGATAQEAEREYHPRILRGQVHAPSGQLAARSVFPIWLVPSAHAAPLEDERTVPEATVQLYRVDAAGRQTGEVLREAVTDMTGEWCMKLPDGVDVGADLMLEARADDTRLRRSVVSEVSTDLYSTAEALTRLLIEQEVDFTKIPDEIYLNMESIADTRVDLLEGMELADGDTVGSTVGRIQKVLVKDDRLMEKVRALAKR